MMLLIFKFSFFFCLLSCPTVGVEFDYKKRGNDWRGSCQSGRRQSPIDVKTSKLKVVGGGPSIAFHNYDRKAPVRVEVDASHFTIKVTPTEGHDLMVSGGGLPGTYKLRGLHFHWPSEHTIDGKRFILEAHLVHIKSIYNSTTQAAEDPEGIAVLGVLYKEGKENPELMKVKLQATKGQSFVNFDQLLPSDKSEFFRYKGSLTTPRCNEVVVWTVFSNIVPATYKQVAAFRALLPEVDLAVRTYRDAQPHHGRVVELWSHSLSNNISPNPLLLIALILGLSSSFSVPKILNNY